MSTTLHELFEEGIKDIYNAEKQLLKALPKMMKMAQHPELRMAFETHMAETEEQIRRLEECARVLGFKPAGMMCQGMKGLIEEANEHMKGKKPSAAMDAEIIGMSQKTEHYEIASYGTLCEWAKVMGHNEALTFLKQNLAEEEKTDKLLSVIAEREINMMAVQESQQMMMGDGQAQSGRSRGGSTRGKSQTGGRAKSGGTTTRRSTTGTKSRAKAGAR